MKNVFISHIYTKRGVVEPGSYLIKSVIMLITRKKHEAVSSGGSLQLIVPANIYIFLFFFLNLIYQNFNFLKEFLNFYIGFLISRIGFPARGGGCHYII